MKGRCEMYALKKLINKFISEDRKIYIYSGAGISAESGLSTFRGNNGLWNKYNIDDICNFITWQHNYDLVHEFYNQRRTELKNISPNKAHYIIAELQNEFGASNVINLTTNVDDLFEKAGVKNTIHLHGNLNEIKNTKTNEIFVFDNEEFDYKNHEKNYKPNVVFFNERPYLYTYMSNNNYNMKENDVVVSIGMSFAILKPERFIPSDTNVVTFNINNDSQNHENYNFENKLTMPASLGMAEIKKYLQK
jgi:NAD-dependent deacetylase